MKKPISPCPHCGSKNHQIVDEYEEQKPNGKPHPKTRQLPLWEVLILKCQDCMGTWRQYRQSTIKQITDKSENEETKMNPECYESLEYQENYIRELEEWLSASERTGGSDDYEEGQAVRRELEIARRDYDVMWEDCQ